MVILPYGGALALPPTIVISLIPDNTSIFLNQFLYVLRMSPDSDYKSCEVDYDSNIDRVTDFNDSSDDEQDYDSDSKCEIGPNSRDPGGSVSTSASSLMISLPVRPNPTPPG